MKTLEKSRHDRLLGGVCGGFARYLGIDSDLVRVLWIGLGLLGGIGVVPYLAALLLLPESDSGEDAPGREPASRIVGLALIGVAGWLGLGVLGLPRFFALDVFALWTWRFVLPFALLAAGALVLWPKLRERIGFGPGRRLHRSISNRVLAGVAGGIAEEWDVDANLVRVALVLTVVLTGGLGLVLYVVAILVMREEEVPIPPVAPATGPPVPSPAPSGAPPAPAPEGVSEGPPADQGSEEGGR